MASNQFQTVYKTARREGYRDGFEKRIPLFEIDGAKLVNRLRMRARFEASKAPSSFENVNPKDVEAVDTWIAGYLRGYDEGEERMSSYRYQDTGPVPTEEEIAKYARYLGKSRLDDEDMAKLQEIIRVKRAGR